MPVALIRCLRGLPLRKTQFTFAAPSATMNLAAPVAAILPRNRFPGTGTNRNRQRRFSWLPSCALVRLVWWGMRGVFRRRLRCAGFRRKCFRGGETCVGQHRRRAACSPGARFLRRSVCRDVVEQTGQTRGPEFRLRSVGTRSDARPGLLYRRFGSRADSNRFQRRAGVANGSACRSAARSGCGVSRDARRSQGRSAVDRVHALRRSAEHDRTFPPRARLRCR